MSVTTAPGETTAQPARRWEIKTKARSAAILLAKLAACYLLLLAVHAWLGRWTPEYLQGRDLWHFWFTRMIVPMVMLGVFASVARLVPAAILLAAAFLFIGTISAIKREATGEPFQVSDMFLAGQSVHLFNYVSWQHWLLGAAIAPASWYFLRQIRVRWWSVPLALVCAGLLSTYRLEPVAKWIHDNSWWIGVENLTFSQAESERMNGLGTHLYFSTAGLRLKTFTQQEVSRALDALHVPNGAQQVTGLPATDVYVILGEAWWRDPDDKASPLDALKAAGFTETSAVSPVYGGTTPNAEFEVLTAVPVKSFQAGIIPYQHYMPYVTEAARALPRLLGEKGYATAAYHNFTRRFWLRDQMYPKMGFGRFVSMEEMSLVIQENDWPTDAGLYAKVLDQVGGQKPQFHFLVTVETHGPYKKHESDVEGHNGVHDYRTRLASAVNSLIDFEKALRKKGRPYAIVLFGDHLPGLRLHQWKNGMKSERDPRLHQVPVLIASNSRDAGVLAKQISGRPLYCFTPLILDWIGLPPKDRYLQYVASRCGETGDPAIIPSEAVIQNQLFSKQPL